MNEDRNNSRIAELGRLSDKVIELYGMVTRMKQGCYGTDLYAGTNSMLLGAEDEYSNYRKKLDGVEMSEDEREKIRNIIKRADAKLKRMKRQG